MTLTTYIALAIVAFCAGWVDSIAGGGGLLTVPALFLAGLPPKIALGTNKLQALCGTVTAAVRFTIADKVQRSWLTWLLPLALAGSASGTLAVLALDPNLIKPLFIPVFAGIGIYMAVRSDTGARADESKQTSTNLRRAGLFVLAIGFYDGFFGPGTGVFLFMVLVLVTGLEAVRATATTKLVNATTNLAALIVFLGHGSLNVSVGVTMALANACGGFVGSQMALKRGQRLIRYVVVAVVLVLSARLAYDTWWG